MLNDHAARPDDDPAPGDRCKDCGAPVTWVGPSQYDWEHVTPDAPARPFQAVRGKAANYKTAFYKTREARDKAAARHAEADQEPVHLHDWQTPDGATGPGWWLVGVTYPAGQEPAPVDPRTRYTAAAIVPGDKVTVFGAPAGQFGVERNADHDGTVLSRVPIDLGGVDGYRIRFTDDRKIDVIEHAVTTIHDINTDRADTLG